MQVSSRLWAEWSRCKKCGRHAAAASGKATMLERHGVENAMQLESTKAKARETTRAKHGVDHYTQTDEYREKVRASNLENYGVEFTAQRDDVKAKIAETFDARYGGHHIKTEESKAKQRATNLKRYGVENVAQSEEVKAKISEANRERYGNASSLWGDEIRVKVVEGFLEKYGATHPMKNTDFRERLRLIFQERYGVDTPAQHPPVLAKMIATRDANGSKYGNGRISNLNRKLAATIEKHFGVVVEFEHLVGGLHSFDLYIASANLLIELNPTITHNAQIAFQCVLTSCDLPCARHEPRPNDYHYRRALAAQEEGYSLIQIYDWDSEEDVLRLLSGKLENHFTRYSARKLTRVKLAQKEANAFLSTAHVQGSMKGQSHCYGLKNATGDIVAVATFGPSRFGAKEQYEWLRYAVATKTIIHGGPNALWREFVAGVKPESAISYVDFDHSTSLNLFLAGCGFAEDNPTGPSLAWSKGSDRIYNNSLLKLGADRLLGTAYGSVKDSGLKNNDIMLLEGWLPVYTSGNRVFRWTAPTVEASRPSALPYDAPE